MEWKDNGLIIGLKRHGENSLIVELMTENHGRHLGLVRSGRSARMRPILQPGNLVEAVWRARLEEHLGLFQLEPLELKAAKLMSGKLGLYALQTLNAHLRLLPERDPHPGLYHASHILLDHLDEAKKAARLFIRFELQMLEELGFGLDLSECAATGSKNDLIYVSPKSGRAVSREAGEKWKDKLLALPSFLLQKGLRPLVERQDDKKIEQGFKLATFFLDHHVYEPRGIKPPAERDGFIREILKGLDEV